MDEMDIGMVDYKIIRSNRKTIAIHITKEANVEVRAPIWTKAADIEACLLQKSKWIEKHRKRIKDRLSEKENFDIKPGDTMIFLGTEYPVKERTDGTCGFDGNVFFMPAGYDFNALKQTYVKVYKALAKQVVLECIDQYEKQTGLHSNSVKINSAKTRWGSCSGKNDLNFSWRLVLAPRDAVEYVVVHELAHTKEHNHSQRFWNVVQRVLPDYKERQKQLKAVHQKLIKENWD